MWTTNFFEKLRFETICTIKKIECQIPAKSINLQVFFLIIFIISGSLGWADSSDLDSSQLILSRDASETNEIKFEELKVEWVRFWLIFFVRHGRFHRHGSLREFLLSKAITSPKRMAEEDGRKGKRSQNTNNTSATINFDGDGIRNVFLKADYVMNIKKNSHDDIYLYRTLNVLYLQWISLNCSKCLSAILHHLLFSTFKINFWWGARG